MHNVVLSVGYDEMRKTMRRVCVCVRSSATEATSSATNAREKERDRNPGHLGGPSLCRCAINVKTQASAKAVGLFQRPGIM